MWFPDIAKKRPVSGHTDGPMRGYLGIVLHVNESNGNLFNWVSGNHDMSCHFEVYKDGSAEQYIDTALSSWCQKDGNWTYLSMETEGYAREPLTDAQLTQCARIVAATAKAHGYPLRIAGAPGVAGFGWHGMGGASWGGHTGCPGDLRKHQMPEILSRATSLLNGNEDSEMLSQDALTQIRALIREELNNGVTVNYLRGFDTNDGDPKVRDAHQPETFFVGIDGYKTVGSREADAKPAKP